MCAKELLAVMPLAQKPKGKKRYACKNENQDQTKEKGGCEVVVVKASVLSIKMFEKE